MNRRNHAVADRAAAHPVRERSADCVRADVGSSATGKASAHSDLDVAVASSARPDAMELRALTSRLEALVGRDVDLVLLEEAPPGLAYRVFRDGRVIFVRDALALTRRRVRAILEYLDFR